jgi:uncharacterized membrane protein YcaP (DUF421 family)
VIRSIYFFIAKTFYKGKHGTFHGSVFSAPLNSLSYVNIIIVPCCFFYGCQINTRRGLNLLWNNIWFEYWKDFRGHTKEELIMQVLSVVFILLLGIIAIKIIGKKSIKQMTLVNVLFVFVLSSTLGALITKPNRVLMGLLVVITIVIFVVILEKMQLKSDTVERIFVSPPAVVYKDGQYQELALSKNNMTIDILESLIRDKGYPSLEVCKTVIIEPTGSIAVELLPEYEPVQKIYFDKAMKDILKAIDDIEYIEAKPQLENNLFVEAKTQKNLHDNGNLE